MYCVPLSTYTKQRGVSTMTITMIIVLLTGLAMAYTSRNAINEQRLSANELREKQAFAAASAGIDYALAYMATNGVDGTDSGTAPDVLTASAVAMTSGGQSSYYQVRYCDNGVSADQLVCPTTRATALSTVTACTTPSSLNSVMAFSCGWSDDNGSVRKITQRLRLAPSLGGNVSTPLISKGTTNLLTGGASVLNHFNDLTVWTGQSILGQSNTGKTFINSDSGNITLTQSDLRNSGNSPSCNNPPSGYTCSTQGSTIGHDTISGDTRLSTLTSDQFFSLFFGTTPTLYRDNVASYKIDLSGTLTGEDSTSLSSLQGMGNKAIWVDGDVSGLPTPVGEPTKPVVLIINGNLDLSSNTVINGLVFVTGNVTGNGNPEIYGSLIVAGTSSFTGNLLVVYDPWVTSGAENVGKAGKVPGSWRDW